MSLRQPELRLPQGSNRPKLCPYAYRPSPERSPHGRSRGARSQDFHKDPREENSNRISYHHTSGSLRKKEVFILEVSCRKIFIFVAELNTYQTVILFQSDADFQRQFFGQIPPR
eukprot:GHVP01035040.1.p1 GENE.GHVP01035040.1~~GHVP01035040.1.p1  ORF type:complete len:114 (+),score=3.34 GHVP01035040.1:268-609(+)